MYHLFSLSTTQQNADGKVAAIPSKRQLPLHETMVKVQNSTAIEVRPTEMKEINPQTPPKNNGNSERNQALAEIKQSQRKSISFGYESRHPDTGLEEYDDEDLSESIGEVTLAFY